MKVQCQGENSKQGEKQASKVQVQVQQHIHLRGLFRC